MSMSTFARAHEMPYNCSQASNRCRKRPSRSGPIGWPAQRRKYLGRQGMRDLHNASSSRPLAQEDVLTVAPATPIGEVFLHSHWFGAWQVKAVALNAAAISCCFLKLKQCDRSIKQHSNSWTRGCARRMFENKLGAATLTPSSRLHAHHDAIEKDHTHPEKRSFAHHGTTVGGHAPLSAYCTPHASAHVGTCMHVSFSLEVGSTISWHRDA